MKLQKLLSYVRRAVDDYHMKATKSLLAFPGGKTASVCSLR